MIKESRAIVVSDTSVKDGEMGGAWMIKNNNSNELISNEIYHKEWKENSNRLAEVKILLELIQVIEWKSRHISNKKIEIALDCYDVYYKVVKQILTINYIVGDRGGEIAVIRKAIEKASIMIELHLKKASKKKTYILARSITIVSVWVW